MIPVLIARSYSRHVIGPASAARAILVTILVSCIVSVLWCVLVTISAVCHYPSPESVAATRNILSASARLKVKRIHASAMWAIWPTEASRSVVAFMVKIQSFRNRADEELIGNPVRSFWSEPRNGNLSVSFIKSSGPHPTSGGLVNHKFIDESFEQGRLAFVGTLAFRHVTPFSRIAKGRSGVVSAGAACFHPNPLICVFGGDLRL